MYFLVILVAYYLISYKEREREEGREKTMVKDHCRITEEEDARFRETEKNDNPIARKCEL